MSKVVIISGSRKGIGRWICEHYLDNGHLVAGCSRTSSDLLHENYSHYDLDVSNEKQVVAMIRSVAAKYGRIDILVNNAGIASMNQLLLTPLQTVRSIFEVNYMGAFLLLRETAKVMMRKKQGRIINISSVAMPLDLEGEGAYASSKAALESLTRIAARELGPLGITVNTLGPSWMDTDLTRNLTKDQREKILSRQAVKRMGNKNDVLNVIDFFSDDKSDFISGQVIYLGGISA